MTHSGIRGVDAGWLQKLLLDQGLDMEADEPEEAGPVKLCSPHHWRIAEANGSATVDGVCVRCGATRRYRASGDVDDWRNDIQHGRRSFGKKGAR